MKLISSSGKKKHVAKKSNARTTERAPAQRAGKKKVSGSRKILIATCSALGLLILLGGAAFSVVRWQIEPFYSHFFRPTMDVLASPNARPPVRNPGVREIVTIDEDGNEVIMLETVEVDASARNEDIFTFLVLGIDLYGNTDAIMVASFDTDEQTMNVVSIPRDTLVNVSWSVKKANSIHAVMRNRHSGADNADELIMQQTLEEFGKFLGFVPDFMVTVNMQTLPRLIDGIGGVEYRVPRSITHEGFTVPGGLQTLNGRQALHILRYRGFATGDIGRMGTQQGFLEAAARQILANRNTINVTVLAEEFLRHVRTDIQLNHLIWFGREFIQLDSENVNFTTMPGIFENIAGGFYISVLLDEWVEMVNTHLNPNDFDVTPEMMSILTRGPDGRLFVTDDDWAGSPNWGANSRAPRITESQTYTG